MTLDVIVVEVLVAVSMGLVGATTRIFLQYRRDGSLPSDGLDLYARPFLGCVASVLTYLSNVFPDLRALALACFWAGYAGADMIENRGGNGA